MLFHTKNEAITASFCTFHGKGDTNTIIMGGWNNFVGEELYKNIVGPHGLGRRNHRGLNY